MKSIRLDVDGRVIDQAVDYVRIRHDGKWRTFHLDWELASPIALPWIQISAAGPGEGYCRLGRIRELYFHKIRERFAAKLTRIGTEVPPLFPRSKGGKVLIRCGEGRNACYKEVLSFTAADELLWEFGKIKLAQIKDGKLKDGDPVLMHQASRKLIEKLDSALRAIPADAAEMRQAADIAQRLLLDMTVYMSLMRPIKPGARGGETAVEVFQPAEVGTDQKSRLANAKATIVIAPFLD
jgi:hypothetical protein